MNMRIAYAQAWNGKTWSVRKLACADVNEARPGEGVGVQARVGPLRLTPVNLKPGRTVVAYPAFLDGASFAVLTR